MIIRAVESPLGGMRRKEVLVRTDLSWMRSGRVLFAPLVVLLALSLSNSSCCRSDCCTKDMRQVYIKVAGDKCQIVDQSGDTKISVTPGDWVVWNNQLGRDVDLNFAPDMRLFGVAYAISYAEGEPLMLQVRGDASAGEHSIEASCGITMPPPVIIVLPPN